MVKQSEFLPDILDSTDTWDAKVGTDFFKVNKRYLILGFFTEAYSFKVATEFNLHHGDRTEMLGDEEIDRQLGKHWHCSRNSPGMFEEAPALLAPKNVDIACSEIASPFACIDFVVQHSQ